MQRVSEPAASPPKYIIDEPAKEDKFQSHSSIVDGIIRSIVSEPRIRLIGLLGRWGTGKSTIIQHLEKRLESESAKFIVFKYDAWAHQGDPARRSILEELILSLIGRRLTRPHIWRSTLQEISGEKEDSFTKKESKLTWLAKILILFLLPLPFIMSLLDFDVLNSVFSDEPNEVGRAILIATLIYALALFGLFPLAFLFTRKWATLAVDARVSARLKDFWTSGPDILSLILTRNTEDSSSTTVRKPQPTTIEFRRILRRIIQSQKASRLVFVVDNLDRIDPLEALGIWSVVVGLVADEAHRVDLKKEPLVIVPLDKEALADLVKAQHNGSFDSEQLIEKSFDVVFEVPPPVLSDWREFFEAQFRFIGLATENQHQRELYWTTRYFEAWCELRPDKRVTPRKINRFLNQIVSLRAQQAQHVDASLVAYYVANKPKADSNILEFMLGGSPPSESGTEWQTKFAAIHFGVRHENAAQVLLGDELRRALEASDENIFRRIATVRGFSGVLEKYIEEPPKLADGRANGGVLIGLAAYLSNTDDPGSFGMHWDRLWGTLAEANLEVLDTATVPPAIRAFLAYLGPPIADTAVTSLCAILVAAIDRSKENAEISSLIEVGSEVLQARESGGQPFSITIASIDLALKILRNSKSDSSFAASIQCDSSFEDLAQHFLGELESDAAWSVPGKAALIGSDLGSKTFVGDRKEFYEGLVTGMGEIIRSEDSANSAIAASIRLFSERGHAQVLFDNLANELKAEGVVGRLTTQALDNPKSGLLNPLIALRTTYNFDVEDEDELQKMVGLLGNPDSAYNAIIAVRGMNDASIFPVFRKLELEESNLYRLFETLLPEVIRRNHLGRWIDLNWAIVRFKKFRAWLSAEASRSLAGQISKAGGFEEAVLKVAENDFVDFVEYLERQVANALVSKRLAGYSTAEWSKLLSEETSLWSRIQSAKVPLLDPQLKNSNLHTALISVIATRRSALGHRGLWRLSKMLPYLEERAKSDVVSSAARQAIERTDAELLLILSKSEGFREETTKRGTVRDVILTLFDPLSRSAAGRVYIERNIDSVKSVSPEKLTKARARLERASKSKDESVREWARFVSGKLR